MRPAISAIVVQLSLRTGSERPAALRLHYSSLPFVQAERRGPSWPPAAHYGSRPAPRCPRRGPGSGTRRRPCRRYARRGCRSARRQGPAAACWQARAQPRRAAARRPKASTGGDRAARRGRACRAIARARSCAACGVRAPHQLRQNDVFDGVEFGQQVVELVDEAEQFAAQARAAVVVELGRFLAGKLDRALEPALEQARPPAAKSICPIPTAQAARRSRPAATVRSTPRSTSIVTSPWVKLRSSPRVARTGSLIAQHLYRVGARRLVAPGRASPGRTGSGRSRTIAATSNGSVFDGRSVRKRTDGSHRFCPVIAWITFTTSCRKNRKIAPRMTPSTMPSEPIVTPTVTNTFIIPLRLAPMVLRIAMSRVFARTSMISDDRMLNTATSTISDRTTNIATRSTSSAWNRAEFICRQSTIRPRPWISLRIGATISWTLSGSVVWISIIPTWSPISSSSCASCIGRSTNALS